MAEPLKNSFGPDVARLVADMMSAVYGEFDRVTFLSIALDGFEDLELTSRARQISRALAATLPEDRAQAVDLVTESLNVAVDTSAMAGMAGFVYLPMTIFIAEEGLECFEESMRAQYEITQRFTAEFSVRAFIERYPEQTMARLEQWAQDPNHHVRRLVSEGTQPRLPWAGRLRGFQEDPAPVIRLLEMLKDDPEEYVRRSVANNLNDISKDHPELVVEVARRWWKDATPNRKRLVRHDVLAQRSPHW